MYQPEKVSNRTQYHIRNHKLECREMWMFIADDLGFGDSENPAMELIKDVSTKYPSLEVRRDFYCDEQSHRYASTAGFQFVFHRLTEAKEFCDRLNGEL